MYIKAVELSIANNVINSTSKTSGKYEIIDNGKKIKNQETNQEIEVGYKGKGLTKLDLRSFDTSQVIDMMYMFRYCSKLKSIYIGKNWIIGDTTNIAGMFVSCDTTSLDQLCEPNSTEAWCIGL